MLLFLMACTTPGWEDIDSGLFTEKPCKAPCWHNLTPGLSTADDVDHFVNTLSMDEWAGRFSDSYESGCKYIQISDTPDDPVNVVVEFHIENGKLTFIQSVHSDIPTLGQIVDHLGPPEYIKAILAVGPEESAYGLQIYYPKQGLAFLVAPDKKDVGYIKPAMRVFAIQYFSSGDLLSYLTVVGSCDLGQSGAIANAKNDIAKYVQTWSGFGEVKVITSK